MLRVEFWGAAYAYVAFFREHDRDRVCAGG
jgi:hypothetical protein